MKRNTARLRRVGTESLALSIEIFNRASPLAREQGVLLTLQHALEMLFKAGVREERGSRRPYSFKQCLGILHAAGHLDEADAVVAATIDAHCDGVRHHGAEIGDQQLYVDASGGLGVFDRLLARVFDERLRDQEPFAHGMLPVSADPPREFQQIVLSEIDDIRELLQPPRRRHARAFPRLRTLVVSERMAHDPMAELAQPSETQLAQVGRELTNGKEWIEVFPTLARLTLEYENGSSHGLRLVKRDYAPALNGNGGAPQAEYDHHDRDLDHYRFYLKDLGREAGITRYNTLALARHLALRDDPRLYRVFLMGRQRHERYSQDALDRLSEALAEGQLEKARAAYVAQVKRQRQRA